MHNLNTPTTIYLKNGLVTLKVKSFYTVVKLVASYQEFHQAQQEVTSSWRPLLDSPVGRVAVPHSLRPP